ncbi:MAG: (2Fe-2S)-binding protein [Bacteroidales bacterium]|nr:(2Fe-2S)-binding protein [Bacteroidales bacterium]MCF8390042.1 (2Fe-2S)-binding protein [Bacteroidales bacterium]
MGKIHIKIDSKEIEVNEGISVIDAARATGIEIPSMCYREGKEHITSCMVCLVKDAENGKLFPSCSINVQEGMQIISMDEEIQEARKTALELLLSEHVGDCEAPCQITCPAHMDIPLMNRLLSEGNFEEALKVVKKDIALPAVFGRVCPAPCEGACRRKSIDEPVSICLLKRSAGDKDILGENMYLPQKEKSTGKSIAIIGAGPAGLAAAYFLQIKGYSCTIYDRNKRAGGSLKKEVEAGVLPAGILAAEVEVIAKLGAEFIMDTEIDASLFNKLKSGSDALIIASGQGDSGAGDWGLEMSKTGILADNDSYQIGNSNIFVVGSALKPSKLAIRTLGQGKEVSFSVDQFLKGEAVRGEQGRFNSRFGKLFPEEFGEYMKESVEGKRAEPADLQVGLTHKQVMEEAKRCLHCDCREIDNCTLRDLSDQYKANQRRFYSEERKKIVKHIQNDAVIYEPAKCIKCGICVDITAEYMEDYGFTFIGRGFDIEIGVPFNKSVKTGLEKVAREAAEACPTGALSKK